MTQRVAPVEVGAKVCAASVFVLVQAMAPAWAFDSAPPRREAFVQLGAGEGGASMAIVGATWHWSWHRDLAWGRATGYWDVSVGRWRGRADPGSRASAWVSQFGVTPVVRLHPRRWNEGWFVEAGIGANVLAPLYRSRDKRFSTVFNFGDHVGVGVRFGPTREHELSLRLQHFSNAGIRRPNPGENFVQLRYARRI